ncbi:phosphotransferase family protein [Streptomyces sp. NPDC054829]
MPPTLAAQLTRTAAEAAHAHRPAACPCRDTGTLADRPDATVVRHADTVAKAHPRGTDPTELTLRLATATTCPDVLLPPLQETPTVVHERLVTFWPYGEPVDPRTPDTAPWAAAATLLARLHRHPPLPRTPPMRGPAKAARAVERLKATEPTSTAATPVLQAWHTLPAWARGEAAPPGDGTLCHGDFHLGQLVRHPTTHDGWRLIDVDDLGTGTPTWDLARPAAWYACGLLPPEDWTRFLTAYRDAGGPAVPPHGDPWPALDIPARALTVQTAATAITKAARAARPLDEVEQSLIDACARMAATPPELTCESAP